MHLAVLRCRSETAVLDIEYTTAIFPLAPTNHAPQSPSAQATQLPTLQEVVGNSEVLTAVRVAVDRRGLERLERTVPEQHKGAARSTPSGRSICLVVPGVIWAEGREGAAPCAVREGDSHVLVQLEDGGDVAAAVAVVRGGPHRHLPLRGGRSQPIDGGGGGENVWILPPIVRHGAQAWCAPACRQKASGSPVMAGQSCQRPRPPTEKHC